MDFYHHISLKPSDRTSSSRGYWIEPQLLQSNFSSFQFHSLYKRLLWLSVTLSLAVTVPPDRGPTTTFSGLNERILSELSRSED